MVTAGVFLLMRVSPILEFSSTSLMIVVWLGALGALMGAAAGLVETDLKRVVAFSTLSQLGYMIVAIGISQFNLALFHLFMHAFFKRRQSRYFNPADVPSLGNLIQGL
jgi:NADH-ubiquinone oxidoreductase chain 5